ncbi:GCYA1 cyclase, partial [Polypterus senegalus]
MFCAKLKELKITGECPFSMLVQNEEPGEFEESADTNLPDAAEPVSKEVVATEPSLGPQRKTSRSKVNLHSLGESVRKLVYPETPEFDASDLEMEIKSESEVPASSDRSPGDRGAEHFNVAHVPTALFAWEDHHL